MIIGTLTVTTTPTTIFDLVETARGTDLNKSDAITEALFRTPSIGTAKIYIEETGTATAVTLLDPADGQAFASYSDFDLKQCLLSSESGSVSVGIVASQVGVRA